MRISFDLPLRLGVEVPCGFRGVRRGSGFSFSLKNFGRLSEIVVLVCPFVPS